MKGIAQGFTLIEWMIYFFLVMVVATGIFHYVVGVRQHLVVASQQSGMLSQLCAAQDVCARDLSVASSDLASWQALGPVSLAWQKDQIIYCWAVESGFLVRREKVFDPIKRAWISRHKSVVAYGTIELAVEPLYKSQGNKQSLVGVQISLRGEESGKKIHVSKTVTFRNGRVS